MTQQPLFSLPPCPDCKHGRIRNRDTGSYETCIRCGGSGVAPALCRMCSELANGKGSYCDRHDPATAEIPF